MILQTYTALRVVGLYLLYADDILLIAPSVTGLQQLLHECEGEICWFIPDRVSHSVGYRPMRQ